MFPEKICGLAKDGSRRGCVPEDGQWARRRWAKGNDGASKEYGYLRENMGSCVATLALGS